MSNRRNSRPFHSSVDRDGVAGDAGLRTGEQALLAEQPVDQRRLADVRTADHRDANGTVGVRIDLLILGRRGGVLRQGGADRVVEVGEALAVLGGERDRIAEAERVGLGGAGARASLALVGDDDHRLAGAPHDVGEGAVDRRQAAAHVDQEQHRVGAADRHLGLRHHARGQAVGRGLVEARGVDDREAQVAEAPLALAPVARHARPVIDQREPPADQAVEQGRLADIRPSHDGESEAHEFDDARRREARGLL